MFKAFVFLSLVAACACVPLKGTQTEPGIVKLTFDTGDDGNGVTNNGSVGVQFDSTDKFPKFGHTCTTNHPTVECKLFTCTTADNCALTTGSSTTVTVDVTMYAITRDMASIHTMDKGFVIGDNTLYYSTVDKAALANSTIPPANNGDWTKTTVNIKQFEGAPKDLTLTMNQVAPDVVLMSFVNKGSEEKQYSVGWKEGSDTWPTWAASCNPTSTNDKYCIFVKCTAFDKCEEATAVGDLFGAKALSNDSEVAVVSRNTVGPDGFTIASGEQDNMLYYVGEVGKASDAAILGLAGNSGWSTFEDKPEVKRMFPVEPVFDVAMSTTSPTTLQITMTTNEKKYGAVGWQKPGNMYPEYVYICDPAQSENQCKEFFCTTDTSCTGTEFTGSKKVSITDTRVSVVSRNLVATAENHAHTIIVGKQNLLRSEGDSGAVDYTMAEGKSWDYFTETITKFTGTKPTFGASAAHATADTVALSVTTNPNKYAMTGFNDGVVKYPSFVTVCEPATQATCGVYSCSSDAACKALEEGVTVTQTRDQANRSATVTAPKSVVLPDNGDAYLYWAEKDVPSPFKIEPALSQEQTWSTYLLPIGPVSTNPTFNATFSRPTDTTLETTLVPGTGKTVFFGWRKAADALYPTDALICAPSVTEIGKCLDASCTKESECTARATTIYTANTAKDTTASVTRTLTAGDVKLVSGEKMYLAWDLIDTPANTTTLEAATLKDRKEWKYYEVPLPASGTKSSAHTIVPSIFAVLLALLYVIA